MLVNKENQVQPNCYGSDIQRFSITDLRGESLFMTAIIKLLIYIYDMTFDSTPKHNK